ncbi:MAG: SpaA isopeptide-forming pilin-related protein, partial [Ruminococcus sp.]|nr:SpaA isopeptide-forming pilin-related protein [Ruminococcus sp.]
MRKSLGKRLISGVTAALTAVMIFPNVAPTSMAGETADINSAKTIFSLDREGALAKSDGRTFKYANELFAQLNFEDEAGEPADVKVGDNQYYLLVHAVGMSSQGVGYKYKDGENRDYYKLYEIGGGPSWTTEKFGDELRPYYTQGFGPMQQQVQPATERVDGILLKNNGSGELSLEDATALKDCEVVDSIGDYTFLPSSELSVRTTGTPDPAYGNDTVAVTARANTYVVDLNVYDVDGNRSFIDTAGSNYYMLTYIAENADSAQKRENLKGWAIKKVTPDAANHGSYYQEAIPFGEFISFGENGSDPSAETIKYDKDKYAVGYRLYRTLNAETELSSYADCVDTTKAADTIPSYIFSTETGKNSATVNVYKDQLKALNIELDFDEPATIKEEDGYYAFVTVEHQSGGDSYYLAPIVVNESNKLVLEPQSFTEQHWVDNNGNALETERFTGTEKSIKFEILKAKHDVPAGGLSIGSAIGSEGNRTSCAAIASGDTLSSYVLTEGDLEKTTSADKLEATYTKKYNLKLADYSSDLTYDSILGNGVYFGIVADRYNQNGHAETNFAANYYQHSASAMAPDLAGPFAGHIYIANYYEFPFEEKELPNQWNPEVLEKQKVYDTAFNEANVVLPADIKDGDNKPGTFKLDTWGDATPPTVHVPNTGAAEKSVGTNGTGLTISPESSEDMMNKVVQPMIDQMIETSNEMVKKPATIKPVIVGEYAYIDGTGFDEGANIYVDADSLLDYMKDVEKLDIRLNKGQMVIFNFDDEYTADDIIKIKYPILYIDGEKVDAHDDKGKGADTFCRSLVYNLNTVKNARIDDAAGIFLNPNADSEMRTDETSRGWLMTAGYYENRGSEWHFVYKELPDAPIPPVTGGATFSKKDAATSEELPNAKLTIKLDGPQFINFMGVTAKQGETNVELEYGSNFMDPSISFTSGTEPTVITGLKEGKYKLIEDTAPLGYKKVTEISFEITSTGKIKGKSMLVINDAPVTATISKQAGGGGPELPGAELTVTLKNPKPEQNLNGVTVSGGGTNITRTDNSITFTSGDTATQLSKLPEGEYELKENTAPLGYAVKEEAVTFKVDKEGNVTGDTTMFDSLITATISKKDASNGGEELEGAKLTVKSTDETQADLSGVTAKQGDANVTLDKSVKGQVTFTSGKEKTVLSGLPAGKYTLTEDTAPLGYTTDTSVDFEIDDKGEVVNDTKLELSDKVITATVSKRAASNSAELKDAELTVKSVSETPADLSGVTAKQGDKEVKLTLSDDKSAVTFTSGEVETILSKLPAGKYELTENKAPAGYETKGADESVTFTIDDKGNVTGEDLTDGKAVMFDDAVIEISKKSVSDLSKELKGATMVLTSKDSTIDLTQTGDSNLSEDKKSITWTSGDDSKSIKNLPDGVYTLRETAAPEGFEAVETEFTFTIKNGLIDGTPEAVTSGETKAKIEADGTNKIQVLDAPKATPTVAITKPDASGSNELKGATIQLTGKKKDDTVISFNDGAIAVPADGTLESGKGNALVWISGTSEAIITLPEDGIYTIHETAAPKGYKVTTDITFEVKDGEVVGKTDLQLKDDTIIVTISKKGLLGDNTKELPGAKLTVKSTDETPNDLSGVTAKQGETDITAKLDTTKAAEGQISFTSGEKDTVLSQLPAGKYQLIEDTAPLGYTKATAIDFVVDKDGNVKVDEKTVKSVDMTDELITATISKQEISGGTAKELEGAKLTVKSTDETQADLSGVTA